MGAPKRGICRELVFQTKRSVRSHGLGWALLFSAPGEMERGEYDDCIEMY